jgi:hypothetical protein
MELLFEDMKMGLGLWEMQWGLRKGVGNVEWSEMAWGCGILHTTHSERLAMTLAADSMMTLAAHSPSD